MKKILLPWQKFEIWYHFQWLNVKNPFQGTIIATPTWFLTHSPRQIQRRVDAYHRERIKYLNACIEMATEILEQRKLQDNQNNTGNTPVK